MIAFCFFMYPRGDSIPGTQNPISNELRQNVLVNFIAIVRVLTFGDLIGYSKNGDMKYLYCFEYQFFEFFQKIDHHMILVNHHMLNKVIQDLCEKHILPARQRFSHLSSAS